MVCTCSLSFAFTFWVTNIGKYTCLNTQLSPLNAGVERRFGVSGELWTRKLLTWANPAVHFCLHQFVVSVWCVPGLTISSYSSRKKVMMLVTVWSAEMAYVEYMNDEMNHSYETWGLTLQGHCSDIGPWKTWWRVSEQGLHYPKKARHWIFTSYCWTWNGDLPRVQRRKRSRSWCALLRPVSGAARVVEVHLENKTGHSMGSVKTKQATNTISWTYCGFVQ